MHPQQFLLKAIALFCLAPLLLITVQPVYGQEGGGQTGAPQLNNCSPIPAPECQIQVASEGPLDTDIERWGIQLDDGQSFPPELVQEEPAGSIAIVIDASDVMREINPTQTALLQEIANSVINLNETLVNANQQINDIDINKLSWSIFFIGAENASDLYSWCDNDRPEFACENNNVWKSGDLNLPGNAVYLFSEEYSPKSLGNNENGTPFYKPLESVISYFATQTGPKHIVCFCEGLDAAGQSGIDGPITLALDNNILIHVVHMWKAENLDATDTLNKLTRETGGEFVTYGNDLTPIWQAITQELNDYQYTLTTALPKLAERLQVSYQNDDGTPATVATTVLSNDLVVEPVDSSIAINGWPVDLAGDGQPQQIVISPNATGINVDIDSDNSRVTLDTIEIEGKTWTVADLRSVSVSDLFSTDDKPTTLQGSLTLVDSAGAAPTIVPLTLAIARPASPLLLEFATDESGDITFTQLGDEVQTEIPVKLPEGIDYELTPRLLVCKILGGSQIDIPTPGVLSCPIPFDELREAQGQLVVSLYDQFGFEYSGQAPLRLVNGATPVSPPPSWYSTLYAAVTSLPNWIWWPIGLVLLAAIVIAMIASRRLNQPAPTQIQPMPEDRDITERIAQSDMFPQPQNNGAENTERIKSASILAVAKFSLAHAPTEDRKSLAPDITIYADTLKWGIGRDRGKLRVEPEYHDTEPIEIEAGSISRVHARLEFNPDLEGFFLIGDMTPNGTYINRTILDPLDPYPLQAGDEVQFGKIAYKFELLTVDLQEAFMELTALQNQHGSVFGNSIDADPDPTER